VSNLFDVARMINPLVLTPLCTNWHHITAHSSPLCRDYSYYILPQITLLVGFLCSSHFVIRAHKKSELQPSYISKASIGL